MRKKQLRNEVAGHVLQNAILRARVAILEARSDELVAEIDERDGWFSPDSMPLIVETVLDELIVQLLEYQPKNVNQFSVNAQEWAQLIARNLANQAAAQ